MFNIITFSNRLDTDKLKQQILQLLRVIQDYVKCQIKTDGGKQKISLLDGTEDRTLLEYPKRDFVN